MKVALVIASLGTGGAERVMSVLANCWADAGHEVTLITLGAVECDVYPVHTAVNRVALGLVADSGGLARAATNNWRRVKALRKALRDSGAAIVLSFESSTNVLVILAALGTGLRCVISERTDPARHSIGAMWTALRRLAYPFADALVVQTAQLLPWARRMMLRASAAHVIPNPLRPLAAVTPSRAAREPLVVAVGRLGREKGYDVLIRAFAELGAEFQAWRLVIVGEGDERAALGALVRRADLDGRVTLPGWMPVPEGVFARASAFVMSSRYEGFPNALLEAMASGLPVIATTCGAVVDLIEQERNGILVEPENVAQLAEALRRVMGDADLRERLAIAAANAAQRYSPRTVLPMWDAVLSNSCPPKHAAKFSS